jgi:AcrR family transcriptional regulator
VRVLVIVISPGDRRRGFEDTTIDHITAAAGVSRRTFFNYFPTKLSVLARLHREVTEASLRELESTAHASPGAALWSALGRFGESLEGDHALAAVLMRVSFSSEIMRQQDEIESAMFYPALVRVIRAAQDTGELAPRHPAAELAGHLMAVVTGALIHWALTPASQAGSLSRLVRKRLELALNGLRPGPETGKSDRRVG